MTAPTPREAAHPFDLLADGLAALPAMVPGVTTSAAASLPQLIGWLRNTPARDAVVRSAVPPALAARATNPAAGGDLAALRDWVAELHAQGAGEYGRALRLVIEEINRRLATPAAPTAVTEDGDDVERALRLTDEAADSVGHWPKIANLLAAEVRRLRGAVTARRRGAVAAMLAEFHAALGQAFGDGSTSAKGRADMQQAETHELASELMTGNRVGIARELADVVYIAYGTAFSHGIDLDAVVAEVHAANMRKGDGPGGFIVRDDGKVMKPPGWTPPDVELALAATPRPADEGAAVPQDCDTCRGSGELDEPGGTPRYGPFPCPDCDGTGSLAAPTPSTAATEGGEDDPVDEELPDAVYRDAILGRAVRARLDELGVPHTDGWATTTLTRYERAAVLAATPRPADEGEAESGDRERVDGYDIHYWRSLAHSWQQIAVELSAPADAASTRFAEAMDAPTLSTADAPRGEGEAAAVIDLDDAAKRLRVLGGAMYLGVNVGDGASMRARALDLANEIAAHRCTPPAPEVVSGAEAAALEVVAGPPKTVHEALCSAQAGLSELVRIGRDPERCRHAIDVLSALLRGVEAHRPIGANGKHGDQHTATCGCDGHEAAWSITVAAPTSPKSPLAVGDVVESAAQLDELPTGTVLATSLQGRVARRESSTVLVRAWSVTGFDALLAAPEDASLLPARILDMPAGGA